MASDPLFVPPFLCSLSSSSTQYILILLVFFDLDQVYTCVRNFAMCSRHEAPPSKKKLAEVGIETNPNQDVTQLQN